MDCGDVRRGDPGPPRPTYRNAEPRFTKFSYSFS